MIISLYIFFVLVHNHISVAPGLPAMYKVVVDYNIMKEYVKIHILHRSEFTGNLLYCYTEHSLIIFILLVQLF